MKELYTALLTILFFCLATAQGQERYPEPLPAVDLSQVRMSTSAPVSDLAFNPDIGEIIDQTNLDTLVAYVNILSGEDSVWIQGTKVRILNRRENPGNDLAADYIKMKLESYGLEVFDQSYSEEGRNVYAKQPGIVHPEKEFILCAHYDAVDDYCADDNASGVAAVLEAARILSQKTLDYTLVYALWDEEEIGLIGSNHYASRASETNAQIQGVINMDMIAWDSNLDRKVDIHSSEEANSDSLADILLTINSLYELNLNPVVYNPGTRASDHSSFWGYGYKAVLLIEGYYADDLNPYYHSEEDRIDKFDLDLFHDMTRLAIGSISVLTTLPEDDQSGIGSPGNKDLALFPNPVVDILSVVSPHTGPHSVEICSSSGQVMFYQDAEEIPIQLDLSTFQRGIYFITIQSKESSTTRKIIKLGR